MNSGQEYTHEPLSPRHERRGIRHAVDAARHFWRAYTEMVAAYQTGAILTVVYLLVVCPVWAVARLTGHHFLPLKLHDDRTLWRETQTGADAAALKRQG